MARVLYANHSYPSHLKLVGYARSTANSSARSATNARSKTCRNSSGLTSSATSSTSSVDETDDAGKRTKSLAGADNIHAARAAFDALVPQYAGRRIILREGARILLVAKGGKIEGYAVEPKPRRNT